MIESDLTEAGQVLGHTVKLTTGRVVVPSEENYRAMLDKAAEVLYDEPVGSTLRVGRLIIEKLETDFDVYMHVGTYTKENND